jgi:hypothetical protein
VTGAIVSLHVVLGDALVLFSLALGIWGAYLYFRRNAITPGFRSSFLVMAGLTVLQGVIGLGAFVTGSRPGELLHIVYGVFAALFLPGVYLYAHGGSARREAVFLAGACWIVLIAYLRGFATG